MCAVGDRSGIIDALFVIEGASDGEGAAGEDVRVDHGRADVAVPEKFLDGSDVISLLEEVGRERVP